MINLNKINKSCVAAVIMAMCLMTSGCSTQNNKSDDTTSNITNNITTSITAQETNVTHADDAENYKTEITGEFTITSGDNAAVTQNASVYTITQAGEYTVTGLLSEGQIVVDAADDAEITIILNGTSISCSTGSPIYVNNASEVKIKSEENTYNKISDTRAEATGDSSDEAGNAAIYATCDLKLVGKGALSVTGNFNNGIQSKDDISVKNVILKVIAANNAIKGNDAVDIESGEIIAISKKGDGIKTSNSSLSDKGNQKGIVTITGGNIDIYAACDGIDAAYGVDVSGDGNLNIYTDSYSEYSEEITGSSSSGSSSSGSSGSNVSGNSNPNTTNRQSSNANMVAYKSSFGGNGDRPGMPGDMNSSGNSSGKSYSTKGIKAESEITISGATINISSTDDGIHTNADSGVLETGEAGKGVITISGGTINIASGDDGIHADKELNINDGYVAVSTSLEGLEAMTININGGKTYVYATDDGLNACTGDGSSTPLINITGGYVDVTTPTGDTDGIDSNGNYTQSGGMVLVKGGSSSGSMAGSIDVDKSVTITGGTCIALGGICETPVNSANAYVLSSVSFNSGSYSLKDSSGNEVLSFTLTNSYFNGWICSSNLKTDTEYTLSCDGNTVASWTQTSGTMGASNAGGFGGNRNGNTNGKAGGNMNGGNMNGGTPNPGMNNNAPMQ